MTPNLRTHEFRERPHRRLGVVAVVVAGGARQLGAFAEPVVERGHAQLDGVLYFGMAGTKGPALPRDSPARGGS
jgi:hypothetical protein